MFSFLGWGAKPAEPQQKRASATNATLKQLGVDPSLFEDISDDEEPDLSPPAGPPEGKLRSYFRQNESEY